jgi:hypothetical protein
MIWTRADAMNLIEESCLSECQAGDDPAARRGTPEDPRFVGYWAEVALLVPRLPRITGDLQLLRAAFVVSASSRAIFERRSI